MILSARKEAPNFGHMSFGLFSEELTQVNDCAARTSKRNTLGHFCDSVRFTGKGCACVSKGHSLLRRSMEEGLEGISFNRVNSRSVYVHDRLELEYRRQTP